VIDRSGTRSVRFWHGSKRDTTSVVSTEMTLMQRAMEASLGSASAPSLGKMQFLSVKGVLLDVASFLCTHGYVRKKYYKLLNAQVNPQALQKYKMLYPVRLNHRIFQVILRRQGSYCYWSSQ